MVDTDAVNLVREALKSGKTENEVVVLMKQAGYTDVAIFETLAEAKKGTYRADELARRIAAKNNIPVQPNLPRLGPQNFPSQPPRVQPMPQNIQPGGGSMNMGEFFGLWFKSIIHPKAAVDELKTKADFLHGFLAVTLGSLIICVIAFFMLNMLIGIISPFVMGGPSAGMSIIFVLILFGILLGVWFLWGTLSWAVGKLLGSDAKFSNFMGGFGFAFSSMMVFAVSMGVLIFLLYWVMAKSMASSAYGSFTSSSYQAPNMLLITILQYMVYIAMIVLGVYTQFILFVFTRDLLGFGDERGVWSFIIGLVTFTIVMSLIVLVITLIFVSGIFVPASSYGSVDLSSCKSAAGQCSIGLATGSYANGDECVMCNTACSINGQEVVPNAVQYCKEGNSSSIR